MNRNYIKLKDIFYPFTTQEWVGATTDCGVSSATAKRWLTIMPTNIAKVNEECETDFDTSINHLMKATTNQDAKLYTLIQTYLFPKYYDRVVTYYDGDNLEEYAEAWLHSLADITNWLESSYQRYSPILTKFASLEASLLNDVTNKSISKFNDTPQTASGTYDDTYQSSITTNESIIAIGDNMDKLMKLEAFIKDYYEQWAKEFERFIIWSAEYE